MTLDGARPDIDQLDIFGIWEYAHGINSNELHSSKPLHLVHA
jgi:hypothetical protein